VLNSPETSFESFESFETFESFATFESFETFESFRAGGLRIAGLFVFRHDLPMRAEYAAALTNFLLLVLIVTGLMLGRRASTGLFTFMPTLSRPPSAQFLLR
jgi:hypothetical protein